MTTIFISYRRDDSRWQARMIYDALRRVLPRERVFMDVDSIPPGADFVETLERWVGACEIMLAVIGPGWIGAADLETGLRRLDNEFDFVRIEIREALRRGIPVVPVLLDEARMPDAKALPDDLTSLARRQAETVRFLSFDADVARLMRKLGVEAGDARPETVHLATPEPPSEEQRLRAEGRIPVQVGGRDRSEMRRLKPGSGEPFCDLDGGPEMIVVPAGSFMMGSPESEPGRGKQGREGPWHKVTFARPFAVGRHAVTRGQFAAFVEATGRLTRGDWRDPGFMQDDSHPVVHVTWEEAKAFAAWMAKITDRPYRLLTEAEWEYAARAGTATPFWWGSSITPAQANYCGTDLYEGGGSKGEYRGRTVGVDSFDPNPWGLYNVHGNVWEWCEDIWHPGYDGAPADGSAWTFNAAADGSRVVRGGAWYNHPKILRAANRDKGTGEGHGLGFRLARSLTS
jgi:formylglycine-generating enzyme required for sulfatase activity